MIIQCTQYMNIKYVYIREHKTYMYLLYVHTVWELTNIES